MRRSAQNIVLALFGGLMTIATGCCTPDFLARSSGPLFQSHKGRCACGHTGCGKADGDSSTCGSDGCGADETDQGCGAGKRFGCRIGRKPAAEISAAEVDPQMAGVAAYIGPGRFHPVPTHPVFFPGPPPLVPRLAPAAMPDAPPMQPGELQPSDGDPPAMVPVPTSAKTRRPTLRRAQAGPTLQPALDLPPLPTDKV